jgi:hypothetical protein
MTGRYEELETRSRYSSEYYVRDLPDGSVVWIGERIPSGGARKGFTNVFLGQRVSPSQVEGDFIDIPQGGTSAVFRGVRVDVLDSGYRFDLPGIGQRTLVEPDTFPSGNLLEWGAGFYDEASVR